MKRVIAVVSITLFGLLFAVPAFAQYGGSSSTVTLKNSSGTATNKFKAGAKGTLTADHLLPNKNHDINFSQSPAVNIGSGRSNSSGVMTASFTIPTTAHAGAATLEINPRGVIGSNKTVSIEVIASGAGLPTTGREILRMAAIGLSLLIFGGLLTVATRRRRMLKPTESEELVSAGSRS